MESIIINKANGSGLKRALETAHPFPGPHASEGTPAESNGSNRNARLALALGLLVIVAVVFICYEPKKKACSHKAPPEETQPTCGPGPSG